MAVSRFQEIRALESEVGSLRDRLEVRKLLDRAKGLLQSEHGLSEPEAFRWIQKTSMDRRVSMRDVAQAVLDRAVPGPAASPTGKDTPPAGQLS
jgi:response regulator NasT